MEKILISIFLTLCSLQFVWAAEDEDYSFAIITYSAPQNFTINVEHFKSSSDNEARMKAVFIMYAYIGAYNSITDYNILFADIQKPNPLPFEVLLFDSKGDCVDMIPRHSFEMMAREASNSPFGYDYKTTIGEIKRKFSEKKSKSERHDLYNTWPFPVFLKK